MLYRIYDVNFLTYLWNRIKRLVKNYAEAKANKVTALSAQSTDAQYPSAKVVFDSLGDKAGIADVMFPNFSRLTPKKVFEYDVSDYTYHPLFSRTNVGISRLMSEVDDIVKFRVTMTGTNIYTKTDVVVKFQPAMIYPAIIAWNETYNTAVAYTGICYFKTLYPKNLNSGYGWLLEYCCNNSNARHVKVEIFEDNENITWFEEKTASPYNSTYWNAATVLIRDRRGLCANLTWYLVSAQVNNATVAAYISTYLNLWLGGTPPKAGEALLASQLAILSERKVYKVTNKAMPIDCDCGVMLIRTTYAVNATLTTPYIAQKISWTVLNGDPLLTHDTFVNGDQVYLRCTLGNDGKIYPDGHLSNVKSPGYTWVHIGTAASATAINLDTCGKPFITLDSNGYCTHINGVQMGATAAIGDINTILDTINGEVL